MKQSGKVVDTNSERSISKTWAGLPIDSFAVGERKIQYSVQPAEPEKQAKAVKGKAPAAKQEVQPAASTTDTREIKSIKTYRQKSAFKHR